MVRPAASKSNKELMLLFANMTTYSTDNAMDWIARTGNVSVYSAFSQCCASCVRIDKQGPSDGLAPLEANKVLEDNGYVRVRSRRAKPTLPSEIVGDENDGPSYYYSNRRWRNPSDPSDCAIMRQSWELLVNKHRHVSLACTFEKVLEVVERCRNIWAIKNPVLAKKRLGSYSKKAKRLANGRFASFDADNHDPEFAGEDEEAASALSALQHLSDLATQEAREADGLKKPKIDEPADSAVQAAEHDLEKPMNGTRPADGESASAAAVIQGVKLGRLDSLGKKTAISFLVN